MSLFDRITVRQSNEQKAKEQTTKDNRLPIVGGVDPYKSVFFSNYGIMLLQDTDFKRTVVNRSREVVLSQFAFLCRLYPQINPSFVCNEELRYIGAFLLDDEESKNYWHNTQNQRSQDYFIDCHTNVLSALNKMTKPDTRAIALYAGLSCLTNYDNIACERLMDILLFEQNGLVNDEEQKDILELWVGIAITCSFIKWYQTFSATYYDEYLKLEKEETRNDDQNHNETSNTSEQLKKDMATKRDNAKKVKVVKVHAKHID